MRKEIILIILLLLPMVNFAQENTLSLSLEEAIKYGLENNYNNKTANKDIEAAKKQKWETTTIGLPQINAVADYQYNIEQQVAVIPAEFFGGNAGEFQEVIFAARQNINASVTLRQLLFDGSYLVALQSAKTFLKISQQAKEKTELLTREAIINAYGNVLVAEKNKVILESNKTILEKNLSDTKKVYENGLTEQEDVEQLEITLGNLESQLKSVERLIEIGYKMLNLSIGSDINTKLILEDSLEDLVSDYISFELMSSDFNLDNHIDFQIAENNRKSKELLVKYEKNQSIPSLSAFVNYGTLTFSNNDAFFDGGQFSQQWFDYSLFGLSVNIPVFSSFRRSAKTQRAKIDLDIAEIRLQETKQQLNLKAESAKSDYKLSIDNYQTAKKNLDLAERIEVKHRIKFAEGISTSFELTQAQNQLYTQQQTYVKSMLDVIAKKAALENALNIPINK